MHGQPQSLRSSRSLSINIFRRQQSITGTISAINFSFLCFYHFYWLKVKVPITPKSFFRLIKSLHLFETHCAFLPLFNSNIDLLQAVKVTKSGHHQSHDRASKGDGSIPCLTSPTSLHACLLDLIRCKSVCEIKQGLDPCSYQLSRVTDDGQIS